MSDDRDEPILYDRVVDCLVEDGPIRIGEIARELHNSQWPQKNAVCPCCDRRTESYERVLSDVRESLRIVSESVVMEHGEMTVDLSEDPR